MEKLAGAGMVDMLVMKTEVFGLVMALSQTYTSNLIEGPFKGSIRKGFLRFHVLEKLSLPSCLPTAGFTFRHIQLWQKGGDE